MLILSLLLYASLCWSKIPTITSSAEILAKPLSLIYFHAFDCQYCLAFDPDIEFIAGLYNDKHQSFQIVKVDGRKSRDLVQQFQVTSFPTLKLYDNTKKQVSTFTQKRTVANVESFIEEFTDLRPDYSHIQKKTHRVKNVEQLDALRAKAEKTVLVFVNEVSYEWEKHYYPNHFYQQLASEYPDIQFGFKFIEEEDSSLMAKYHVSNVPSLIYFHRDTFTIYNTLSTNQMTNSALEYEQILNVIQGRGDYQVFSSVDELEEYAKSQKYEGHKQWKGGFNYVESRFSDYDDGSALEEQFEDLLAALALG